MPASPRRLVLAALTVLACGCGDLVTVRTTGDVALRPPAQTSTVVAADGSVLAELHAVENRTVVPLAAVPQVLRDAVLAVEDSRFYSHGGVDIRAVARAFVTNARSGRVVEGGSTITQQLAKNVVVGDERTLERKLEEASVALQIESRLSKDEILERYLNTVYFGRGAYGVAAASRRWFGVGVEELDLPQSALLAALVGAPGRLDPAVDPEAARQRRDLVLARMRAQGFIDPAAAAAASETPVVVAPPPSSGGWRAPWFVDHVLDVLQHDPAFEALGSDPATRADLLFRGGLRIETTLDPEWQASAEASVREVLSSPEDPRAALVALDPATGGIRALVGGRDYDDPADPVARFNLAVDARRQPGSTFKAIVLAAALARGRSLDEVLSAPGAITIPIRGAQAPWEVANYDGTDWGRLTLREATRWSVNTVYAQLISELGPEAVVETARALGIRQPLQPYLSLALGAQEVTPLELATVAATLSTGGIMRPPSAVTRVVASDGRVLFERGDVPGERVLDDAAAWLTTTALEEVVTSGTGTRADLRRPVAGKTGTTTDTADAWFMGYTPDLAASVWIGFPGGRIPMVPPRTRIRVEGGTWPAEIFGRFGLRALASVPASAFPIPDVALVRVRVDTSRGCLPNPYTPPDLVAERAYLAGTEPTELCREPTGPPTLDVPSALGLPREAAQRLLNGAGFTVVERPEFSPSLPPGYVVRQDPAPGEGQQPVTGFTVTVWVSSADRTTVEIPDVLGLRVEDARVALEAHGFVVEVAVGCPDGAPECTGARSRPGRVWEQVPDAGAALPRHSAVRLFVYPSG